MLKFMGSQRVGHDRVTELTDWLTGTVMATLGVSFHLLIEDQGLVLSASLSHLIWSVLCCVLGLCHSFKSCALPLSLLLQQ